MGERGNNMIDKYHGNYRLICDICEEQADKEFDSFDDAVDYKRNNGWKSQKKYGEWQDVCPECQD